jgi:hypothetical protein
MEEIFLKIVPYLLGGFGGASLTLIVNNYGKRMRKMVCFYILHETIAKVPVLGQGGATHQNLYEKHFLLKNTTGIDIASFKIIFEFDAGSTIVKNDTLDKTGTNQIKSKKNSEKKNEIAFIIKNFNRNDEIKFLFEIADIINDHYNVTEAECTGFKIIIKEKLQKNKIKPSKVVTKESLQR